MKGALLAAGLASGTHLSRCHARQAVQARLGQLCGCCRRMVTGRRKARAQEPGFYKVSCKAFQLVWVYWQTRGMAACHIVSDRCWQRHVHWPNHN